MKNTALYSATQCLEIDQLATEKFGYNSYKLMERAGQRAFDWIVRRKPDISKAVVLCGAGNNGGDGYVVARLLREAGVNVTVIALNPAKTMSAKIASKRFAEPGGDVQAYGFAAIARADLLVDAIFGAGLTRAPADDWAKLIRLMNQNQSAFKVALDVPSGVLGDTGFGFDPAFRADLTVTFIAAKIGLHTGGGIELAGDVVVEDLGISAEVLAEVKPIAFFLDPPVLRPRNKDSHKGSFGNVTVAGGDRGMLGATLLAGRAALRTGAGQINIVSTPGNIDLLALTQPEFMSHGFEQPKDGVTVFSQADALVIGPGTHVSPWSEQITEASLDTNTCRVIDAGALHWLARFSLLPEGPVPDQVLTPHPGEAAAILGCATSDIQRDRISAARRIGTAYGGTCVLKGAGTIVTDGERVLICRVGNPGMASAGMGDALAGIVATFLAQGKPPFDAACTAVWLHAHAADLAAEHQGEHGLIASDVIEQLPQAIKACIPPSQFRLN